MLISAAFDQTYVCTGKTTQNATWPAFCFVIAIIHEFNLLSVFMVVLFGTNVKRRNLIFRTKFIIILSVCPWTKQQMKALSYFPWRSVRIKLISKYSKRERAMHSHPKETSLFPFWTQKTSLIYKQLIQDLFRKAHFLFFRKAHFLFFRKAHFLFFRNAHFLFFAKHIFLFASKH